MQDRTIAVRGANYILNGSRGISSEFGYRSDGFITKFAQNVLDRAVKLMEKIERWRLGQRGNEFML